MEKQKRLKINLILYEEPFLNNSYIYRNAHFTQSCNIYFNHLNILLRKSKRTPIKKD